MTTTDIEPRTDLAGWLGLAPAQADYAKRFARTNTALGKLGRRLIAQDQADTPDPEPDDGLIPRNPAATTEEAYAERDAWVESARQYAQNADYWRERFEDLRHNLGLRAFTAPDEDETVMLASLDSRIADAIDERDPEPDDGLIAVTVRLTAEQVRATAAIHSNSFNGLDDHGQSVRALNAACRAVDLPAPKPPWTSPLPNLPDLTEQQCRDCYDTGIDPYCCDPWAQIGRALKAAGWTPVEEADRG